MIQADHEHHEDHRNAVRYPISTDSHVTAISYQLVVDEDHDDTRTNIHQERGNADGDDILYQMPPQPVDSTLQMEQLLLIGKLLHLPAECQCL